MIELSLKFLRKNKKQSLTIIIGTMLASILLFSVGFLFSSFREYLISKALEKNDYHVRIKGVISDDSNIISLKEKDGEYYIKFDDINKTYKYTERLCHINLCDEINYNNKLLSLYGLGDNNYLDLFKSLIISVVFILSIAVFFIIYNCFQIFFTKKKKDIFLLFTAGASKKQIYKVFFFEEVLCSILGIICGFILSLGLNIFIIRVINSLLFEFLNGKLGFNFYIPFIWIPFIFMMMIVLFASLMPLFKIRKYKVITILKDDDIDKSVSLKKAHHFIFGYALTNYERGKKKYRGIIICVIILVFLFNSLMSFKKYMTYIFDNYINLPNYDVALISGMDDYNRLSDFGSYLNASKKVIFKSCEQKVMIPEKNYNKGFQKTSNLFITNLGGNKLINRVSSVNLKGNKMYNVDYKPFSKINELLVGDYKINVGLTDEVPFGFKNMLLEGNYVLNLGENDFNLVCLKYEGRAFIKTNEKGLDEKITEYANKNDFHDLSYVNVKKGYEFINNFMLVLKIFVFLCILIISLIGLCAVFNVVSANIKIRKREFATLKSLGFTNKNINLCLIIESLIISFKGCFYAFPFILLINRYLYVNLDDFFDMSFKMVDYKLLFFSFLISFLLVLWCMFLCHLRLYKDSLINNIKDDKF